MATALYRRYRSLRFADLIGQDVIATTLRNEVRAGTLAHAYLFTGIRGTGKTSTARILARAVNCLDLQDGEPCNRCSACLEITDGSSVDVLEIDAASNRGIDEMRDLREKVKYLPAALRRKVYIIDEAHMLTAEAWNAFLKTLEEPPPHVLFVLATTEPHKVPETVRSRVQRFDFRRVSAADITAHLARILEAEGAQAQPEALTLLARAGQGSVRDALSLLDQALAGGERPLTADNVRRALGVGDPAALHALLHALAGGDGAGALRAVAAAFDSGADPRQLLREASRLCRARGVRRPRPPRGSGRGGGRGRAGGGAGPGGAGGVLAARARTAPGSRARAAPAGRRAPPGGVLRDAPGHGDDTGRRAARRSRGARGPPRGRAIARPRVPRGRATPVPAGTQRPAADRPAAAPTPERPAGRGSAPAAARRRRTGDHHQGAEPTGSPEAGDASPTLDRVPNPGSTTGWRSSTRSIGVIARSPACFAIAGPSPLMTPP